MIENNIADLRMDSVAPAGDVQSVEFRIRELSQLGPIKYDHTRKIAAEELNLQLPTLDKLVERARNNQPDDGKAGQPIDFPEPEPWHEPVDGVELLDQLVALIRRYVFLPEGGAETVALWVLHTYAIDSAEISPRLAILSPVKGCGKTTLLDVISRLVFRPMKSSSISAAGMFRTIEALRPTLLIDEADTFLNGNEALRGVLNDGHKRGGGAIRLVGADYRPARFNTFCPTAIAKIGALHPTIEDRSLMIRMKKRLRSDNISSFRERTARRQFSELASKCRRFADDNLDDLIGCEPLMPEELADRAQDNWEHLIAIADVAGSEWPQKARSVAVLISGNGSAEDSTIGIQLLTDIQDLLNDRVDGFYQPSDLVRDLSKLESRPWSEYGSRMKPLSTKALANLLAPFGIKPCKPKRVGGGAPKRGYQIQDFEDAFARYLPDTSVTSLKLNDNSAGTPVTEPNHVTDGNAANANNINDVTDVTVEGEDEDKWW